MKLSIVVPAFNEEACIGRCLDSIHEATRAAVGEDLAIEIIVVDNNSTDSTSSVAAGRGARVVFEGVNRISRARNAGGRAATGDWILFIDADSLLSRALFERILGELRSKDVAGGGALVRFDRAPLWGWLLNALHLVMGPLSGVAGGPCLFIRSEAFRGIDGFREDLYGSEELFFCRDAAAWARRHDLRFVVLRRPTMVTSGRRFRVNSGREIFMAAVGVAIDPRSRRRCSIWYDGRR